MPQGNLLRALSPGLTDREVRFLLASLSEWDVSASGFATYRDVLHALRLSKIAVFDPTPGGGRVPSQVMRARGCRFTGSFAKL